MSVMGKDSDEASDRAKEIISDLKKRRQKRVTLDLSPLEAYVIECIRFNGERSDGVLQLLAFQRQSILQKAANSRPHLRLVTNEPRHTPTISGGAS
jgi:hypothetical protein